MNESFKFRLRTGMKDIFLTEDEANTIRSQFSNHWNYSVVVEKTGETFLKKNCTLMKIKPKLKNEKDLLNSNYISDRERGKKIQDERIFNEKTKFFKEWKEKNEEEYLKILKEVEKELKNSSKQEFINREKNERMFLIVARGIARSRIIEKYSIENISSKINKTRNSLGYVKREKFIGELKNKKREYEKVEMEYCQYLRVETDKCYDEIILIRLRKGKIEKKQFEKLNQFTRDALEAVRNEKSIVFETKEIHETKKIKKDGDALLNEISKIFD